MPWWLTAIVFFCIGAMVQRWVLDRNYLNEVKRLSATMTAMALRAQNDADGDLPDRTEPEDRNG